MGQTYAKSFIRSHIVNKKELLILEKSEIKAVDLKQSDIGLIYGSPERCMPIADLIILAVKPQDAPELYKSIRPYINKQQVFLSIMAGVKIESLVKALDCPKIIRAMPNLACQIGMGMTVFTSTEEVTRIELVLVQNLLNTTGKSFYVADENLLNSATAVSGSGPAYVFYFMDAVMQAAMKMGFDAAEAELLTWQTFKGAVELFHKNDYTCKEWIAMVASKGGTTEAALEIFKNNHLQDKIGDGMEAAWNRSVELGK